MRKRLYIDTSVISHLFADDAEEKRQDTIQLWKDLKLGKFDVYISDVVLYEISNCKEPRRTDMQKKLEEIKYEILEPSKSAELLANEYIKSGVLPKKSMADSEHIALAVVAGCDIIASWNFKHLVNYKTVDGVKFVNATNNYYKEIAIMPPSMLIEKEDKNGK